VIYVIQFHSDFRDEYSDIGIVSSLLDLFSLSDVDIILGYSIDFSSLAFYGEAWADDYPWGLPFFLYDLISSMTYPLSFLPSAVSEASAPL
jgi:hypothetical protein